MDNLYKQIRLQDGVYTIIQERKLTITCIFNQNMQVISFKSSYDLERFVRKRAA